MPSAVPLSPELIGQEPGRTISVIDAIMSRQSIRKFLDKPVDAQQISEILSIASYTGSGSNLQPWTVFALAGEPLEKLGAAIQQAYLADEEGHQRDYKYYAKEIIEPYLSRKRACGWGLYGTLGIARHEKERMKAQRSTNYNFFGAPVGLVCTIDSRLEVGSWLDFGAFVQTVMLTARAFGLHTCAQASIAEYPKIVRAHLPVDEQHLVLVGIAIGYADMDARVNQFRTERAKTEDFVTFMGFDRG
jgi:nitroreductase